jgi:hypothetical protein
MARPTRNANPHEIAGSERIFFATTRTSMGSRLFQSERNAHLLVDVLRSYVAASRFKLHDFRREFAAWLKPCPDTNPSEVKQVRVLLALDSLTLCAISIRLAVISFPRDL